MHQPLVQGFPPCIPGAVLGQVRDMGWPQGGPEARREGEERSAEGCRFRIGLDSQPQQQVSSGFSGSAVLVGKHSTPQLLSLGLPGAERTTGTAVKNQIEVKLFFLTHHSGFGVDFVCR